MSFDNNIITYLIEMYKYFFIICSNRKRNTFGKYKLFINLGDNYLVKNDNLV